MSAQPIISTMGARLAPVRSFNIPTRPPPASPDGRFQRAARSYMTDTVVLIILLLH